MEEGDKWEREVYGRGMYIEEGGLWERYVYGRGRFIAGV